LAGVEKEDLTMTLFADRHDAGRQLAAALVEHRGTDSVVLGVPGGGVPVAAEVARSLGLPLDVLIVRKVALPEDPELALGVVGEGGVRILNEHVMDSMGITPLQAEGIESVARRQLDQSVTRIRKGRLRRSLSGQTALVIDDGVATGASASAACQIARSLGAAKVVLAVPVASSTGLARLRRSCDELVCLATPAWFTAVGHAYSDFGQVSDDEVSSILGSGVGAAPPSGALPKIKVLTLDEELSIPVDGAILPGHVMIPSHPRGFVVFAHCSGSGRNSPRNRAVARMLNAAGFITLLFDLQSAAEVTGPRHVVDVERLASRLAEARAWVRHRPEYDGLPVGYLGSGTGAAAALIASTSTDADVQAVVSRSGRPDLAGHHLTDIRVPTLLIVGGRDERLLALNRQAQTMVPGPASLVVVPGATHLFQEPGTLAEAGRAATDWYLQHLRVSQPVLH
jgi:predicted phosphoribosyltransferase/predicted alpha/beta-hydrolase family hydrolase